MPFGGQKHAKPALIGRRYAKTNFIAIYITGQAKITHHQLQCYGYTAMFLCLHAMLRLNFVRYVVTRTILAKYRSGPFYTRQFISN